MSQPSAETTHPPVMIIVPVYGDVQATSECLAALAAGDIPANARVLIVNDQSPDPAVTACCERYAASAGFGLITNNENLGFVATANIGFSACPDDDVILLNSDTVVSGDWVQRLQDCAYRNETIGTVTPFSNNGTICSYPVFLQSSELPSGWTAASLDALFTEVNQGKSAPLPTAVGFCMYIKRACLIDTGGFDEEHFGRGYGEECDFSLRATRLNWTHVVAADVFVFHKGGASFASQSQERKREADKIITALHPDYHDTVTDFVLEDPLAPLRDTVSAARTRAMPDHAEDIAEEQQRYQAALRETAREYRAQYKRDTTAWEARFAESESRLQQCRARFEATDRALAEAESAVDHYKGAVEELRAGVEELQQGIRNEQAYAASLRQHIENMEASRSWRYTAWLRRS